MKCLSTEMIYEMFCDMQMSATHKYGPFFHQHTFTNENKATGKNILLRQSLNTFLLVFFMILLFIFIYDGQPCIYYYFVSEMTSKGFY